MLEERLTQGIEITISHPPPHEHECQRLNTLKKIETGINNSVCFGAFLPPSPSKLK